MSRSEKKILHTTQEITDALRVGPVFATVPSFGNRVLPVRDVRFKKDAETGIKALQVKVLEGWRRPAEVWIEA